MICTDSKIMRPAGALPAHMCKSNVFPSIDRLLSSAQEEEVTDHAEIATIHRCGGEATTAKRQTKKGRAHFVLSLNLAKQASELFLPRSARSHETSS